LVFAGLAAVLALVLCILGLVVVASQSDVGQSGSPDAIIGSAIICFCPATMALAVALILWFVVIRRGPSS
jgi:hypothetical protein